MTMMPRSLSRRVLAAAVLLTAVSTTACGTDAVPAAAAEAAKPADDPLAIEVGPELKLDIATGEPEQRPVTSVLEVAAHLEADETRLARIGAPVTGRIVELAVNVGQPVRRGQVIATIHSAEIAAAESDFLESGTEHHLATTAVERARQLLDAGVIGTAELQRREAELQRATAHRAAARQRLTVLGVPAEAIDTVERTRVVDSVTQVVATSAGHVLERLVTPGQVVEIAEVLCVVADLSSLWVVADVPEHGIDALSLGKAVEAVIPALHDETIGGRLSFVGATVNPDTRTIRARMDLPNPTGRYKPAMLVTMRLVDAGSPQWTVPSSAVVREGNDEGVFVQTGPNRYLLKTVELGNESGDQRVLLKGVDPGTKIVVQGAFHLNNQRRRLSVQAE